MIVAAPAASASEGTYLESILDALKFLPVDIQRNMQLLYQLDAHAEQLREEIQKQRDLVLKSESDSKKSKPLDISALRKLRRLERKCIKLLDEKLIIAKECYKIANSHLSRVDMDLQRFERELGPYTRDEDFEEYMSQNIGIPLRSRRLSIDRSSPMISSPQPLNSVPPSPRQQIVLDEPRSRTSGPISSEQTYCLCKQASYGQMVACDNEKCPIQWWHFKCAGILETPTGVWYCKLCSEQARG